MIRGMPLPAHLDRLNADELRGLLIESQARIDKFTYELAYYKRQRYGVKAEHLSPEQAQLFEETTAADLAAIGEELERLSSSPAKEKAQAKRKPLPAELPRTEIHHEPETTTCACGCQMKRIGEDIAEKLDYTPGSRSAKLPNFFRIAGRTNPPDIPIKMGLPGAYAGAALQTKTEIHGDTSSGGSNSRR